MSQCTNRIIALEEKYKQIQKLQKTIEELGDKLEACNDSYAVMMEAQGLLASLSEKNTAVVLEYVTGIINKTLAQILPHDVHRIYLERTLYKKKFSHITVKLKNSEGVERDLIAQSGSGVSQIISFLFVLCLIEVRKCRRFMCADELFGALHMQAKEIMFDIIQIFADTGFQFVIVEYGVDIKKGYRGYIVEKPGKTAYITAVDDNYKDEIFLYNHPKADVDLSINHHTDEEYDTPEVTRIG